jgi:CopG family transcriptional regulator, nickel-responsive regulator
MDRELVRTCISLPENLLSRFDKIITKRGYPSRAEGIRDSIRHTVAHYEWMSQIDGKRIGVISFVYNHSQRGLMNELAKIQHQHAGLITSSVHVHLDHDDCLENIITQGEGHSMKELAETIMALKGVEYVKLNTIPTSRQQPP